MESDKLQSIAKRAGRGVIRCYSGSFFFGSFPRQISVRKGDVLIDTLMENFSSVGQKTYRFVLMGRGLFIFNSEDGITAFLRNVSSLPIYTTLYSINP
jgi:hypothetical protein